MCEKMKVNIFKSVLPAIAIGIILSLISEMTQIHGAWLLATAALVSIYGLIRGRDLPLFTRALFTVIIFYFAYAISLFGRTMSDGLNAFTVRMALTFFVLFALWPSLALLRIWKGRIRILLLCLILPVSLALACMVASAEEHLFIRKYHDTGCDYEARWTVSMHCLSYNAETGELNGSD